MDAATKEQLKWKFYRLAVILNLLVLLVAIGTIAFFKAPDTYRIPVALILFLSAAALAIYFRGQYKDTRQWLHNQE